MQPAGHQGFAVGQDEIFIIPARQPDVGSIGGLCFTQQLPGLHRRLRGGAPNVLGSRSLGPFADVELDAVALTQIVDALTVDGALVEEIVLSGVVLDESKPLIYPQRSNLACRHRLASYGLDPPEVSSQGPASALTLLYCGSGSVPFHELLARTASASAQPPGTPGCLRGRGTPGLLRQPRPTGGLERARLTPRRVHRATAAVRRRFDSP